MVKVVAGEGKWFFFFVGWGWGVGVCDVRRCWWRALVGGMVLWSVGEVSVSVGAGVVVSTRVGWWSRLEGAYKGVA